ncbi:hypothetical protein NDU88_009507 [Pleurodeles waltl]|uniref:Secreted protein n=1 Tax=Pleurodeles waltl TaxID=8319 RepID=A0AAV7QRQ5_PLEWA|nr:hypothetical protein NDU88_009507 [Pleurodeles waltl]
MSVCALLSGALVEWCCNARVLFKQWSVQATRSLRDALLILQPLCFAVGPLHWWSASGADVFVVALLEHRCSLCT